MFFRVLCNSFKSIGISSNGRTEAFEAFNRGSNPCIPARKITIFDIIKILNNNMINILWKIKNFGKVQ